MKLYRFIALLLWTVVAACAQIVTGSIVGTVADSSGAAVPEASVTLVQSATGLTRRTATDVAGNFALGGLDAGEFTLTVAKTGFKTVEEKGVRLATGERLALSRLVMEVGALSETISVIAQGGTVVQTQSAERSDLITSRQVEDLLVRGRNVTDLLQLVPGVVIVGSTEDFSSNSNFSVMGNRRTMNNVSVDGVPATDMGNGHVLKTTVSQDAVAEVKILVSNYQAEYGRMSGSNLQIVTKSGTRDFHGLGSYFKRHEQFNALPFFDKRNGIPKRWYRYNTWTYNLGGPVLLPGGFNRKRDKLFLFWQQEFWPTKTSASGRVTAPTVLERAGDFSRSVDLNDKLIALRDPYNNGAPFPGNVVPAARIDRNGQALLKFLPAPNFFDRSISRGQYNYVFTSENDTPKQTNTLKIDYNVNSNNTVVGTFGTYSEDETGSFGINTVSANWPQIRKRRWSHSMSATGRYTRVFSPTVLNEFSFGWLAQPAENSYRDEDLRSNQRDVIGFNVPQFSPKANPLNIVPNATFGGVPGAANIDTEGRFPLFNRYHLFNWSDNFTITRGSHTLKTGAYIERFFRNQKKTINFTGAFDFTRNVNNPLDTNYAYSNAILGVFNNYSEVSGTAWMHLNTGGVELFVQDSWKATRRLTLDYGVRLYWMQPVYEGDDWMAGFSPARFDPAQRVGLIRPGLSGGKRVGVHPVTGQIYAEAQIGAMAPGVGNSSNGMVVASEAKDYPRAMIRSRGAQWGPRLGLAWDMFGDGKTALRGGFGIFYNRYFTDVFTTNFVGQQPLLQTPVITYGELSRLASSAGLLYPSNVFGSDPSGKLATVMNFSLSLQRNIGFGTVVDAGYAGSLGRHLLWRRDINSVPLGANFNPANGDPTNPGKPLPAAFLRPLTGYNNINTIEPAGTSNYHSLQVSAKRRFAQGIQFGAAWTWSKAMDFNDQDTDSVTSLAPLRVWNYGLASFDRTHVLSLNYVWDVPALPVRNVVGRQLARGWQLSGITSFVSGAPLGVGYGTTSSVDTTGTTSLSARIVVTGDPVLPKSERTFYRNFRTNVFRLPAVGTIGNAAKTLIRGPGINNWDVAVFKNFPIRERVRVQFRWELYNAWNHTQFSALDTTARFDTKTGDQVNAGLGQFTAARPPRQMQLALRFYF